MMLALLSDGDGLVLVAIITAILVPSFAAHRAAKRASVEAKRVGDEASAERQQFRAEMHERVDTVEGIVNEVNHAVNNVPKGAPSLVFRVFRLEQSQAWQSGALRAIADHVGAPLPKPPPS